MFRLNNFKVSKLIFVVLSVFIFSLALTACGGNAETPPDSQVPPEEPGVNIPDPKDEPEEPEVPDASNEEAQKKTIEDFEKYLLDYPGIEGIATLATIVEAQIETLSPEYADQMLSLFEGAQIKALERDANYGAVSDALAAKLFEREIFNREALNMVIETPSSLGDQALSDEIQAYREAYFTVETQEGMYYLVIDYDQYMNYLPGLGDWFAGYLKSMARELSARTFSDAAMIISLDEMWGRVTAVEALLSQMDNTQLPEALRSSHQNLQHYFVMLMNALVYGGNNTPVYAYDTNTMTEARIRFYDAHEFPSQTPLYESFEAFKATAKEEGYKLTDRVNSAREAIFDVVEAVYLQP
ncbi:hypothetical protein [Acidaminobacter hydrogenoformans]|uniref:Uncharacterized protein n=1 Tax=Acidaminobacter hydrogenoformans DSM 2784 TaxID=1120920 RepID=A0A1G5RU94_9FIRM|nr:hypothetical protein [Acidaminobacter hydrogenoformans]SCZ77702.1 hypothetical protein SAMN03080599_00900 [Acidaminobacter hydrogenoformans DSM 2784]